MPKRLQSFKVPPVFLCVNRLVFRIQAATLKSTAGVAQQLIPLLSISFSRPQGIDQSLRQEQQEMGIEIERQTGRGTEGGRRTDIKKEGGSLAFRFCPCPLFLLCFLRVGITVQDNGQKDGSQRTAEWEHCWWQCFIQSPAWAHCPLTSTEENGVCWWLPKGQQPL